MRSKSQQIKKNKKDSIKKKARERTRSLVKHLSNYKNKMKKIIAMHGAEEELRQMILANKKLEEESAEQPKV